MNRAPRIGEQLLFHGHWLVITGFVTRGGVKIVAAEESRVIADREKARQELRVLQAHRPSGPSQEFNQAMAAISKRAHAGALKVGLRLDLLSWWQERQTWVADGRMLSAAQIAAWCELTGKDAPPIDQRAALEFLESQGSVTNGGI